MTCRGRFRGCRVVDTGGVASFIDLVGTGLVDALARIAVERHDEAREIPPSGRLRQHFIWVARMLGRPDKVELEKVLNKMLADLKTDPNDKAN